MRGRTRRQDLYKLRSIMERHGVGDSNLPLMPMSRITKDQWGAVRYSKLDMCSMKQDVCDKCLDLVECRDIYDNVC